MLKFIGINGDGVFEAHSFQRLGEFHGVPDMPVGPLLESICPDKEWDYQRYPRELTYWEGMTIVGVDTVTAPDGQKYRRVIRTEITLPLPEAPPT